ncbi:MAG: hypothetical protein NXI09_05870 [Bacteroidetes bacterium]|nr:hypothetical protein [Bacteroidota bacterium]
MKYIILFSFFIASLSLRAQKCACCEGHYNDFKFWLGDWEVLDTAGTLLGYNTIVAEPGNCLMREHWRGASGGSGRSMNFYEAQDSSWHQLWVSSNAFILRLKGGLSEDGLSMQMQSEPFKSKNGQFVRHQISWTPKGPDEVIQEWLVLNDKGLAVNTLFYGIYRRAKQSGE